VAGTADAVAFEEKIQKVRSVTDAYLQRKSQYGMNTEPLPTPVVLKQHKRHMMYLTCGGQTSSGESFSCDGHVWKLGEDKFFGTVTVGDNDAPPVPQWLSSTYPLVWTYKEQMAQRSQGMEYGYA